MLLLSPWLWRFGNRYTLLFRPGEQRALGCCLLVLEPGLEPARPFEQIFETGVCAAVAKDLLYRHVLIRNLLVNEIEDQRCAQVQIVLVRHGTIKKFILEVPPVPI